MKILFTARTIIDHLNVLPNKTKNKTIFSICNGAQLLISSKILKGRILSGYYSIDVDIENAGAIYDRGPVVVDRNIISCPHYDFMGDWMRIAFQTHESNSNK